MMSAHEPQFRCIITEMHMQFPAGWMNQDTPAVSRHRDVCRPAYDNILIVLAVRQQFPDVQMRMALRTPLHAIAGDAPIVAPKLMRSRNGGGPKLQADIRRKR